MRKFLSQIVAAILGIWLAELFVPGIIVTTFTDSNFFGISLTEKWQVFLILGIIIGLLNFFIRPVLLAITLPLRMLTLGIFGILVNMAIIWITDIAFKEFSAPWLWPLLETTVIIWLLGFIFIKITGEKE